MVLSAAQLDSCYFPGYSDRLVAGRHTSAQVVYIASNPLCLWFVSLDVAVKNYSLLNSVAEHWRHIMGCQENKCLQ